MTDFSEAARTLRTVRDLIRFGTSRFIEAGLAFGHGTDNAFDESVYLVLHALHLPPERLEPFLDARLTDREIGAALGLLERRVTERKPAAYLTHEAWLGDFRFYVDERVIVPRSFIAGLLPDGLAPWLTEPGTVRSALDLCTGSGCLAVLLAHAFPQAMVDAVDLSADALDVARRNVTDYQLDARIRLTQSDLFAALAPRHYDVIIANPPYVDAPAMSRLPAEYRHEPRLALAAGDDGFDVVRRILAHARQWLTPTGVLVVEVGHRRAQLERTFPQLPFFWPETGAGEDCVFMLGAGQLAPGRVTRAAASRPPRH
jgi:ribosomal protein L3 glutamine methyltransferase